jgi:hypothetical protein
MYACAVITDQRREKLVGSPMLSAGSRLAAIGK